jgi:two-component system, chemotaxis family, sensor kinase CheA
MDDLTKEFLVESYENLDRMDRDFVELEKNPSKEVLGSIFRAIHTIKGTCGFLGYMQLEKVAHAGENLLSLLRDGALEINQPITDALLAMVDTVREMLGSIEATEREAERDDSALIERLNALQKGEVSTVAMPAEPVGVGSPQLSEPEPQPAQPSAPRLTLADIDRALEQQAKGDSRFLGEILVQDGYARAEDVDRALKQQAKGDLRRLGDILTQPTGSEVGEGAQLQGESKTAVSDSTIRVDVGILDKLMNLVGELVLSRNQIIQFAAGQEDSTFLATSQHLNLVTSELQEGVMKTRMQPIGNVWSKFPRVVRDLAASCKKQVRVEMEGAETELDRTIIEAIKDPLTHVVRNSVDHGIESPEIRAAAGKNTEGRLLLRAYHEGGQVNIEIIDDGGGINPEKIRDNAVLKGLITPEQAARMGEREAVNLIFMPGLSTAEKVSNVSGRGVGMDVVKTNIEKIGGTVDVQSKLGQGTTLKVKIPLTLAIIPALMVTTGGDRYAIPQVNLTELVRLDGEQARKRVEMVHGAPVYRLRGSLLPLVYLNNVLKLPDTRREVDAAVNVVVLQADGRQFGLVVDAINDSKDIVVKPLGKHLKGVQAFAGATILGDGAVALILDVIGISQCANFVAEGRERAHLDAAASAQKFVGERQSLLVCRYGACGRVAIPLRLVARLEEFSLTAVENSSGHEVTQYRGEIMPLIRLCEVLGGGVETGDEKETVQVVVYRDEGRSIGLVVEQIADIVEEQILVKSDGHGGYFVGSAVVQGKVTDILNVRGVIEAVDPSYLNQPQAA